MTGDPDRILTASGIHRDRNELEAGTPCHAAVQGCQGVGHALLGLQDVWQQQRLQAIVHPLKWLKADAVPLVHHLPAHIRSIWVILQHPKLGDLDSIKYGQHNMNDSWLGHVDLICLFLYQSIYSVWQNFIMNKSERNHQVGRQAGL